MSTKRQLLLECGYRCPIPRCEIHWPTLQLHHIDENPSNTKPNNLLYFCPTHHQMATSHFIKRKDCEEIKKFMKKYIKFDYSLNAQEKHNLLYSFASELFINLNILNDEKYRQMPPSSTFIVYPKLLRTILDHLLASGLFIERSDSKFNKLLFEWSEVINEFNHRLDLHEWSCILNSNNPAIIKIWQEKLIFGKVLEQTRKNCNELVHYLIDNYGEGMGIDMDTVFFSDD